MQQSKMETPAYYPGLEAKLNAADPEQKLTVGEVARILHLHPNTVRGGVDGLPEQVKYVRDGSQSVPAYYLSDVVSFLEEASGRPFPDGPLEPLLTRKDVARRLGVYTHTVYVWNRKGILRGFRVGHNWRYYRRDVEAFAESCRKK